MRALLAALLLLPSVCQAAEPCIASVYSTKEGTRTASGIPLNDHAMTAAHKTLPLRSHAVVRCGPRSIVVMITDRGPYIKGRCIDLTPGAARACGINGLGRVTVERRP